MAHDGAIVFNTKIDNSGAVKDLKRLKNEIKRSTETIAENESAKLPLVKQLEDVNLEIKKAKAWYQELQEEVTAVQSAMSNGTLEDYMKASDSLPQLETALKDQETIIASLEGKWDIINQKIEKYDQNIQKATSSVERNKEALAEIQAEIDAEQERLRLIRENAAVSDPRIVEQRDLLRALEATKRDYEKAGLGVGYCSYENVLFSHDKRERSGIDMDQNYLNIDRFLKVWAEILSDHYGVDIKLTAVKKESTEGNDN